MVVTVVICSFATGLGGSKGRAYIRGHMGIELAVLRVLEAMPFLQHPIQDQDAPQE